MSNQKITKQEAFIALLEGKEVFHVSGLYKIMGCKVFCFKDKIFHESKTNIQEFYELFDTGFYLKENKEPKFTPENITKIWIHDIGGGDHLFINILSLVDNAKKTARLATPEEIQAECDRLNKICEEK